MTRDRYSAKHSDRLTIIIHATSKNVYIIHVRLYQAHALSHLVSRADPFRYSITRKTFTLQSNRPLWIIGCW